jgi:hypothetical protein
MRGQVPVAAGFPAAVRAVAAAAEDKNNFKKEIKL